MAVPLFQKLLALWQLRSHYYRFLGGEGAVCQYRLSVFHHLYLFCCHPQSTGAGKGRFAGAPAEGAGLGRGCRCQGGRIKQTSLRKTACACFTDSFGFGFTAFAGKNSCLIREKVQQTGRQGGLSPRDYLGLKLLSAIVIPLLVYLLLGRSSNLQTFALAAYAAVIAWRLPDMQLERIIRQRHALLEKSFPDALDLLTVSVEAGLGFDGAVAKVAEKSEGPVAEEFKRLLQEMRMGKLRKDALRDFSLRCGVEDIMIFTSTVIQAEQLGLNISSTLKTQAEQMRRKRRQRAEEKAMKVPVKMLIPMVIFIFPTIFIVLLGPAIIQIIENFAG